MVTRLRDGAKYETMPSLSGAITVSEFLYPTRGTARLEIVDNTRGESWSWAFDGDSDEARRRWSDDGIPPVVWHFVPATRARRPQLLIAAYRDTVIKERRTDPRFTQVWVRKKSPFGDRFRSWSASDVPSASPRHEHPSHHKPAGTQPDMTWVRDWIDYDQVDLTPDVTIVRVQNPSLMPSFEDPSAIPSSIGQPHLIIPRQETPEPLEPGDYGTGGTVDVDKLQSRLAASRGDERWRVGVLVLPQPLGVVFQSMDRTFEVIVRLRDPLRPGAYAYRALSAGAPKLFLIHHDFRNTTVEVRTTEDAIPKTIWVFQRRHWSTDQVPVQGSPISYRAREFTLRDVPDPTIERLRLYVQAVVETAIGLVPIVGDLYELGQLAYMYGTGSDFWGNEVSSEELVLYGALAAVAIGGPAVYAASRLGKRTLSGGLGGMDGIADAVDTRAGLAATSERSIEDAVVAVGESRLVRELGALPPNAREDLLKQVAKTLGDGGTARDAARAVEEGLTSARARATSAVADQIADIRVTSLVTADMESFTNHFLRWEYEAYRLRVRAPKAALDWLMSGTRNPWVKSYMAQLLGGDWQKVIRQSLDRGSVPVQMTKRHIDLYDRLVAEGVDAYGKLARQASKLALFRQFFELDHVVEQRFLRPFVRWTDALPEDQAFITFLVPKNAAVAKQMIRVAPESREIRYVHKTKTAMMHQRIPQGAEAFYSPQQIADATLFTLKSLGADEYIDFAVFKTDFDFLARAMNKPAPRIRPLAELTEDLFRASAGWPQVERVDGIWRLVGGAP